MDEKLEVQPKNASLKLCEQPPELVVLTLGAFQAITRKMTEFEVGLWQRELGKYRLDDIQEAMRRFAVTATREEARGVVLGDIAELAKQVANERARAEESTRRQQEQRDMEAARERGETMGWGDVMAAIKHDKPELFQLASTIGRAPEIEKVDPEAQRKLKEFEARMVAEYGSMDAYREHQRQKIEQQRAK